MSLVGRNNAGKSSTLQALFRAAIETVGSDAVCFLTADRTVLAGSTEVQGRALAQYNSELYSQALPLTYEGYPGPNRAELFRLLITHHDLRLQLARLDELLDRLGLPPLNLKRNQAVYFEDVVGAVQGAGLRAALPILAALTDDELDVILIDEPEASLEPVLQRALRQMLIEESGSGHRQIVVATHSHLFLNRTDLTSVKVLTRVEGKTQVRSIADARDLVEVTFRLLGNATEDLFFPGNFLVTEGASDQRIAERILELDKVEPGKVKVIAAGGIDVVGPMVAAIERSLVPLATHDSAYRAKVVAVVDRVPGPTRIARLERLVGDRLFVLGAESLEDFSLRACTHGRVRIRQPLPERSNGCAAADSRLRLLRLGSQMPWRRFSPSRTNDYCPSCSRRFVVPPTLRWWSSEAPFTLAVVG
jgi:ABC-type cobalamin transport system ATPase subunit